MLIDSYLDALPSTSIAYIDGQTNDPLNSQHLSAAIGYDCQVQAVDGILSTVPGPLYF